jgi:hypothetical protein
MDTITIAHLDYLQRAGLHLALPPAGAPLTSAPPALRRLWHIRSVGKIEKQPEPVNDGRRPRLPSEDLLTGLFGSKIPAAFLVRGGPEGAAIHLGTWSPAGRGNLPREALEHRQEILRSALASLFPAVNVSPSPAGLPGLPFAGLALGIPTVKQPDPADGALAIDRLIRAMFGDSWACLVLAEPVNESATSSLRQAILEEMRTLHAAELAAKAPPPLLEHYMDLLKLALQNLTAGLAVGAWRTGVYLLGDGASYPRLASLWRGIFSGEESLPEPVQVWDFPEAARLALDWALPDAPGPAGPGHYRHPLLYQTLLTSRQLSAYIHLPHLETSGFAVNTVPDFDVVSPSTAGKDSLTLGEVVLRGQPTRQPYAVRLDHLTRHAFVAGVTGAGKTNTIFSLLKQADAAGVPFLVIEPAKAEYRLLLKDPALAGRLQVFTLGEERFSPFRMNPFEVLPGVPVGVHLDLLRSVFAASFGMWTPLPQVLEQCLYRIYEDRGWDIVANANPRLGGAGGPDADTSAAFPTLSDLTAKVEEVTRELGYEERVTADLRAALLTRLNSLRTGGKGRLLDVQRSLPMSVLLGHPTVLELEGMGDDDDKAFVMGLLFIRLIELRRAAEEQPQGLQHLLVIEEAHRLLARVGERREEEGNPRGKAVETFANLLSEIRAYGQGVIVSDQVPVKLAPEVIKNTNLKVAHRVVAADDRAALAGAMAMNERQAHALATLPQGQAAVFSEGDDAPVVVQAPAAKLDIAAPSGEQVARYMAASPVLAPHRVLFQPLQLDVDIGVTDGRTWEAARRLVESAAFQRSFARLVLSVMEDPEALERLWPELVALARARRPPEADERELLRCTALYAAEWYAQRRGAQSGWPYRSTQVLAGRLRAMLIAKAAGAPSEAEREAFQAYALQLHIRRFDPFPACSLICRQQPPLCLYRFPAADLIAADDLNAVWRSEFQTVSRETWEKSMDAGYTLIEFAAADWPVEKLEAADAAAWRASLCFGQQMLVQGLDKSPHEARFWIGKLILEAGYRDDGNG